ncbi:MAG: class II aldolase/adducin family protein [Draconibacterium sp.]|nr:class II aldolase/adducin family protein [Draconibacterium sp.]
MNTGVQQLIKISQYYGQKKEYVIAGGGNTSYKDDKHLWIKASGINLGDITENGFCVLDRKKLAEIPNQQFSTDSDKREEEVKNALLNSRIDPDSGLRPSVETSLHNLFEYSFVVHTHSTLVNGLMCSNWVAEKTLEIFGEEVLYIPYTDPGYILFIAVEKEIKKYKEKFNAEPKVVLLQNHGIFVTANSIEEIKTIYTDVKARLIAAFDEFPEEKELQVSEKIIKVLPAVRMLLSEEKLKVATAFNSSWTANFISDKNSFEKGIEKPFNPDQMVYCMSEYLLLKTAIRLKQLSKKQN